MERYGTGLRQNRRRRSGACDGPGLRRGRRQSSGRGAGKAPADDTSLAIRTTMRALVAAGTYVAQDVRDRDGLTRPMLRRAAVRMAVSRQPALRRLGSAYLRSDPPAPEELPAGSNAQALPAGPDPRTEVIDVDPATPRAV